MLQNDNGSFPQLPSSVNIFLSIFFTTMLLRSLTTSLMRRTAVLNTRTSPQVSFFSSLTGVVKWFDAKKGFGFVIPDDGSADVFVHHSEIHKTGFRSLAEGEAVEFEVLEEGEGRRKATRVTGPDGVEVQGARRMQPYGGDGFGAGGGFGGSGFGGGGFGGEEKDSMSMEAYEEADEPLGPEYDDESVTSIEDEATVTPGDVKEEQKPSY